jgi:DNA-binding response OmpR family regulator
MNLVKTMTKLTIAARQERGNTMGTKILVVDDETGICDLLKIYFEKEGFEVKTANDGVEAIQYFKMYEPDLVLLDIMPPKKDGWQVCREIREVSAKPVIMITAKGDVFDKVLGLELGADDFVVKPFDMKELSARVKAVLRRSTAHNSPTDDEAIKFENIEINIQKYELKLNGKSVEIPPKELQLLFFLASNYNRVFTRDQLLDKVWGFDYLGDSRTVDVHVKRLREKLEGVSDKWILKTVWGVGYKFELLQ